MASATATIRVPRETRDKLAEQARERGMSLSALLSEIARQQEIEAMFEAERQASLADSANPEALAEIRLWDATLEDGID